MNILAASIAEIHQEYSSAVVIGLSAKLARVWSATCLCLAAPLLPNSVQAPEESAPVGADSCYARVLLPLEWAREVT
eukprot:SAG11_NODE_2593_length_3187_cov_2.489637_4_plen_77_part_00